ncbi:MAG TPA: hypothetical protein VK508_01740 [Cyclobacteriaceae bacterium]|nr:hypothetical protein [Cyclobacteriaceae bacterium]
MKWLFIIIMSYVCNLNWLNAATFSSPATGPSVANGSLHASALDGDGLTVKYNLNSDFNYTTGGQTSGTFNFLVPGTYTVYARSNATCLKTIQVVVEWVLTYTPLYRLQFYDDRGDSQFHYRFDIEDSEFTGDVTELDAFGPEPVVIDWRGEGEQNPFKEVISSQATITLLATSNQEFINLYTTNDRRYRGRFYLEEDGDWVVKWVGFLIPQLYSEPYILKQNYYNTFIFTDGLADLSQVAFSDAGGNTPVSRLTVFDLIQFCLKKTNIELEIWETFRLYEIEMPHTAGDSALQHAYIDPAVHMSGSQMADCLTVLNKELKNLGLRMYQANGHWQIDHVPYKAATTIATRKRAFDGGALTSANESYRIMLRKGKMPPPRVAYAKGDAQMTITQKYGTVNVINDLGIEEDNNLLLSGFFEDEDIDNGQLKNWQIKAGASCFYGVDFVPSIVSETRDGETRNVLKIDFLQEGIGVALRECTLHAAPIEIVDAVEPYSIEVVFDVKAMGYNPKSFIFFDYRVHIDHAGDDYFLSPILFNQWRDDVEDFLLTDGYIRRYITPGDWQTITLRIDPREIAPVTVSGQFNLSFHFYSNQPYDAEEYAGLSAIPTDTGSVRAMDYSAPTRYPIQNHANRARMHDTSGGLDVIRQYTLRQGTDANEAPDIIRPDDYASQGVHYVWELSDSLPPDNQYGGGIDHAAPHLKPWLQSISVDNVRVRYLPNGVDPENSTEETVIIEPRNKLVLNLDLIHSDLPSDENLKNITHGWYSTLDGTDHVPTTRWKDRQAVGPAPFGKEILKWIKEWYQGHNSASRWKEAGMMDFNGVLPSFVNVFYEVLTGRIFIPMSMSMQYRSRLMKIEMIEVLAGQPQTDEGDPDPDIEPPVDIREHTNEFTDEFS